MVNERIENKGKYEHIGHSSRSHEEHEFQDFHDEKYEIKRNLLMERKLHEVERRLRSIEQPVWKFEKANSRAWDRCTEGDCRCQPVTKTLNCWRMGIESLPQQQILPLNMLRM